MPRHLTNIEMHVVRASLERDRMRTAAFITRSKGAAQASYRKRKQIIDGLQKTFAPGEKILLPFEDAIDGNR